MPKDNPKKPLFDPFSMLHALPNVWVSEIWLNAAKDPHKCKFYLLDEWQSKGNFHASERMLSALQVIVVLRDCASIERPPAYLAEDRCNSCSLASGFCSSGKVVSDCSP
jgi:hypothetical protein